MVKVDFSKIIGVVKPMHGIGSAPLRDADVSMFHYLKEAGIPYSRLHDTGGPYGGGTYVDIPNVFRNFNADPENPEAYDFAFTDWLLAALAKQDVKPFYRLGVTIENYHKIRAYNIFPPKDALHWAKICAGIIRHYTQGWANGFYYDAEYWEVWNEPDNMPDIEDNPMWKGTPEEYFHLYEVTSNFLKSEFPHIKVGGYGSCGFYAISDADFSETAHSTSRVGYFIEFFHKFLDYITQPAHKSPLDFFSWHSYAGISENVRYAKYARETLDQYGFSNTESIFDEWNPGTCNRGTVKDAALIAGTFCAMQEAPVDLCMYYDGQINNSYGGMFNPLSYTAFKAYYSFKAFNVLYQLHYESFRSVTEEGLYACAATDKSSGAILLANTNDIDLDVRLYIQALTPNADITLHIFMIDETHDLSKTYDKVYEGKDSAVISIRANSVMLINCRLK